MAKQPPVCDSGVKWLKESSKIYPSRFGGKPVSLAPLTGQDYAALRTFLHALELYSYSDTEGMKHALACMKSAVMAMQPSTQWIARAAIPHLLDWDTHLTLWPKIIAAGNPGGLIATSEACA